ncbi:MAG: NusG domain II-containing protein [Firmicutes bacterium]|nr:NusG domain II-containing protein [Bacillota bacterium]HOB35076.1 NusG domain II-containing protein [Bacillota bacterium]HPZ90578.1 NusG domain II-containing protein [Bacillota bacterium]HQE02196.1 NusG domain II-containing protein [Bacillota bacterium]
MRRGDKVIALILTAVVLAGIYMYFLRPPATEALIVINVDGEDLYTFTLYQKGRDEIIEVEGVLGITKVHLQDGRVRVIESACPDKICVHTGWTNNPAKPIACLPNRVVVKVFGQPEDGVDLQ